MRAGEEDAVAALVLRVFDELVAPDVAAEGAEAFHTYADPVELVARASEDHFVLLAVLGSTIVGMIEVRRHEHVSLLFVERRRHGIARALLERAVGLCREKRPDLDCVTVHSSPYAEPVYARLGFRRSGRRRTEHGITYVPMTLELDAGWEGERSP